MHHFLLKKQKQKNQYNREGGLKLPESLQLHLLGF